MVTKQQYWAALDSLQKARVLEAQKAAAGEDALSAWWTVAEPRWRELNGVLDQAEREDWVRSAVWFDLWRDARLRGAEPGSVDTKAPVPTTPADARTQRQRVTAPATRRIETAGSV